MKKIILAHGGSYLCSEVNSLLHPKYHLENYYTGSICIILFFAKEYLGVSLYKNGRSSGNQ